MSEYNQTRSFNLGIAKEVSVEAALIYDDLAYAQSRSGDEAWFYRSYENLLARFPMFSEQTLRRHIDKLVKAGWVEKKVMRVKSKPIQHFRICQTVSSVSTKMAVSRESTKMTTSSIYKTTNTTTPPAAGSAPKPKKKEVEQKLIGLVNEITGRDFRVLPSVGVKKTLDSFSLEEIAMALSALVQDDWHAPKLKEFSISYFVRSTTIDKFLAIAKQTQGSQPQNDDELRARIAADKAETERQRKERGWE